MSIATIPALPDIATTAKPRRLASSSGLRKLFSERVARGYENTRHCKILIVDDEEFNIQVVRKHLNDAGYNNILTTTHSGSVLELMSRERPDLLLLDIVMPEISGIELLHLIQLNEESATIPILVLTANADASTRNTCLELGVADFLPKPVEATDLLPRVRNLLENKIFRDRLSGYAVQLEEQVRRRTAELVLSRQEVVHCLARAGEFRDDDTGHHVARVGRYVGVIARHLGFPREQVELLELAAQLHDIGKIGIPDAILHKPGKLDADEYTVMRKHCGMAKQIIAPLGEHESTVLRNHSRLGSSLLNVSSSPLLMLASRIAQTHHERWDGTGYPVGLKGKDIPIEGRMTAVADVFDALSSKRPYKDPFPREKCFAILTEGRGTHFDPQVLDAFFAGSDEIIRIQLELMDEA